MFRRRGRGAASLWQRQIRPERVLCVGFLIMILAGTLLLSLPVSASDGQSIGLGKGLFAATSAVCVTGLVVVDTGTAFSLTGQIVLLVLIQTGGLGFMVFATMVMVALGRRITLQDRLLMRESMNTATFASLAQLTLWYGLMALVIEGLGAALLALRFVPLYGWEKGLYYSIWHSVSAFCNAGFDLFGGYDSLTAFKREPVVLLTLALLIILGGTGFAVMGELLNGRFRWRRLSLHTRLVLVTTGGLLLGGTVFIALTEWRAPQTLGAVEHAGCRLVNAFFQAVTMRTAGFNSISLAGLSDGTKLACILMMLVGASPASTGGGMKTTTAAVLVAAAWSVIRGRSEVTVMRRRLPLALVLRALAVVTVTVLFFLAGTIAIALAERGRATFIDLLLEAASAIATVGVTSVGTPGLTNISKAVLIPMMYLGRVGPLTLAMALADRQGEGAGRLRYPEESVTIG